MAKGYWIAHVDVGDEAAYRAYVDANKAAFAKFEGRFIVRGGRFQAKEGSHRSRNIVIEFKDYATAVACYESPDYAAALALRQHASVADLIIVEGYDGPQPGE